MAANVLNSPDAIKMSVYVIRAFKPLCRLSTYPCIRSIRRRSPRPVFRLFSHPVPYARPCPIWPLTESGKDRTGRSLSAEVLTKVDLRPL